MRLLVLALAALLGFPAASRAADQAGHNATRRPSILFFTFDTTRADHTSAYGYARPTTPNLVKLAAEGVRFDAAYAPMATTLPSHTTMFSGLLPRTHGALKNGLPVDPSVPLLSEALSNAGYRTAAFLSSFAVSKSFGLNRGFKTYDDNFNDGACKWQVTRWEGIKLEGDFCRRGDLTRQAAVKWLEQSGYLPDENGKSAPTPQEPFFVWVHFFDPHNPYDPPEDQVKLFPPSGDPPSELASDIAHYDAAIHFADQEMGKLVERLATAGKLDDTLVIVAGDHGEGLMDHGWMLHGLQIYEEAVHVPFVFRWPARLPRGKRITEPVELADLTPTLLEMTGAQMPTGAHALEGMSLAPALTASARLDAQRPVLLQRRFYESEAEKGVPVKGNKHALRVGNWKYIEAKDEGTFELYDLASDPHEKNNLFDQNKDRREALATQLAKTLASTAVGGSTPRTVSAEDAKRLEALGYVQ
jgi:arylsulfatase A-like enzyme